MTFAEWHTRGSRVVELLPVDTATWLRGLAVFEGERGQCFHCHQAFNLTNETYKNNGIAPDDPDIGRERLTLNELDRGKFKVPTLRNVAVTSPYMHDGALKTLKEVIDVYDQGGRGHPNTDSVITPLGLTSEEKQDLLAYLEALTDEAFLNNARFAP
jgi:cytochrome c peroxidase